MFKEFFDMNKFTCSQKKCQAIITNVIAPYVEKVLVGKLKKRNNDTISTDASNHGIIKLFDPTAGVRVKLLEI